MWREDHETSQGLDGSGTFEPPAAFDDGDWPGWLQQDMLNLLPTDLRSRYGHVETTTLNGNLLQIDPQHLDELGSALKAAGYTSQRDDQLLRSASGMLDGDGLGEVLKRYA